MTITAPTAVEAGQFVMMGLQPDRMRRLEHAKINDAPPMAPAYFTLRSELVTVHDGGAVPVRTIQWVAAPAAGSAGITDIARNLAMKAIDAGVLDAYGARVPLSPSAKGSKRDAMAAIGRALVNANSALTEPQAKALARETLKDLIERIGCVVDQKDVPVPQYKKSGQPNGTQPGRGLVTQWHLAPWVCKETATAQPTEPTGGGE